MLDSLRILGRTFDVRFVQPGEIPGGGVGGCNETISLIYVSTEQSRCGKLDTLLHEALHVLDVGDTLKERQVHALASCLLGVLRHNPSLVDVLAGEAPIPEMLDLMGKRYAVSVYERSLIGSTFTYNTMMGRIDLAAENSGEANRVFLLVSIVGILSYEAQIKIDAHETAMGRLLYALFMDNPALLTLLCKHDDDTRDPRTD